MLAGGKYSRRKVPRAGGFEQQADEVFVSGHDFSRAVSGPKSMRLQPQFLHKLQTPQVASAWPWPRAYQGMIFLTPFFFLLVDSLLGSALSDFADFFGSVLASA